MLLNWETTIQGSKVVLVPYRREHVAKYHEWMRSEELQELTGSEPLSLEEEFRMQEAWRNDPDKCTFIVLARNRLKDGDEVKAMVGDTNLFLQEDGVAEAEIMIAEVEARGGGLGWEAMLLMLRYGVEELKVKQFQAKIKFSNTASEKLFKKIGLKESSRSEVFCETTLICDVDKAFCEWLKQNIIWNSTFNSVHKLHILKPTTQNSYKCNRWTHFQLPHYLQLKY